MFASMIANTIHLKKYLYDMQFLCLVVIARWSFLPVSSNVTSPVNRQFHNAAIAPIAIKQPWITK